MPAATQLTSRFEEALVYASQIHSAQVRKGGGGAPYIAHLLGVASLVLEDGGDEEEAVAALLHDTIEDQPEGGETSEQIRQRFGERVQSIVLALTDSDPRAPTGASKEDWRRRKERFLAQLPSAPPDVLRVAAADKLYNAWSILNDVRRSGDSAWGRFQASREDHMWYYFKLVDAFRKAGSKASPRLVEEFEGTVAKLERLSGEWRKPTESEVRGEK